MNRERHRVQIPEGESIRLDKYISSLGLFTRSQIRHRSVRVHTVQGVDLKLSQRLTGGSDIIVEWDDPPATDILPEEMELDILYEDENCIVINKAQGVVVHPSLGHVHGTLVQALLFRYRGFDERFAGDRVRPGIVHRLDKDTSGLIIAAKNPETMEFLASEFRKRTVKKSYLAITRGSPPGNEGEINRPIGRHPINRKIFEVGTRNAKEALSWYRVLSRSEEYALVKVRIYTGRTHQIRVHLKYINSPILGDSLYSSTDTRIPDASLMLHAWKLAIKLPTSGKRRFEAEIPSRFFQAAKITDLNIPTQNL